MVERAGFTAGHFAQEAENLDGHLTVYQEIAAALGGGPDQPGVEADRPTGTTEQTAVRSFAGAFLFRGEDVTKLVNQLSSGERGRLALAELVAKNPDLLVLDEPTNHLDIPAREQVELALEHFPGTILLVSHDRYLLRRLADRVWAFSSSAGPTEASRSRLQPAGLQGAATIVEFVGGYEDYLAETSRRAREAQAPGTGERRARLAVLETRLAVLSAKLSEPRVKQDGVEMARLSQEFLALRREIDQVRDELGGAQA